ncbi:hypothetical protein NQ314_019263 [Rhamnusium bicolor]|uniref:Uncharacterized protein n=1 Tax=Rhamnusium bicolor TaxID=1586634 RepID=A0AAV8WPJ4_9CUCU|nr:hypothetical protein NQ314_019263 [Rhamnusium bicolor]
MDKHSEIIQWFKNMGYDGEIPKSLGKCIPIMKFLVFGLHITIEKLKAKIKENEEREYLLNRKSKMLEKSIQEAEETLSFAKNLTPVELEENPNTKEITVNVYSEIQTVIQLRVLKLTPSTKNDAKQSICQLQFLKKCSETLEKCAEKLEKLFSEIPSGNAQLNPTNKSLRLFHSAVKQPKPQTTFEKYLIMSERKHSEKISIFKQGGFSAKRDTNNKENLGGDKKINKKLFDTSSGQNNRTGTNKRESLGLLPDACFVGNNEDTFLEVFKPKPQDRVSPTLFTLKESVIKPNASKSDMLKFDLSLSSLLNDHPKLEISTQLNLCHVQKRASFDKLYNDEFVTNALKNLLYNHNRHIIWKTFQILNDNLSLDFTKNIIFETGKTENKVNKKKTCIYTALTNQGVSQEKIEEVGRLFEQQIEDVGLDAVLVEMKKEINSAKKIEDNSDLQVTLRKIFQVKDDIDLKVASIKHYVSRIHETLQSMIHIRETTVACVQKLGPFIEDLSWSVPLTQNLCSNETKTFEKFPLEFNRRCIYTCYKLNSDAIYIGQPRPKFQTRVKKEEINWDSRIYYRDLTDNIPTDIELDSESLYMLTNILESPFSPPETVLLNILKSKMKLDALKSLQNHSKDISYQKYSLQELQAQESYIQYALDKLSSLVYSASSSKTLATADFVKKAMEIWLEMPVKDFICPKRVLEGKDYKHYEKHFDGFYNNF